MQFFLSLILGLFDFVSAGARNFGFRFYLIILANLYPILGILFFDWPVYYMMLLYWFESAFIGILNIGKIMFIALRPDETKKKKKKRSISGTFLKSIEGVFVSIYSTAYIGIFQAVSIIFPLGLASYETRESKHPISSDSIGEVFQDFLLPSLASPWEIFNTGLILLIMMVISQSYEFYKFFVKEKAYLNLTYSEQIKYPFPRIIALVVTSIVSGLVAGVLSWIHPSLKSFGLVLVWFFMKLFFDMHHLAEDYQKVHGEFEE